MIAITGASGQLGRLVIENLLKTTPSGEITAIARDPAKVANFADRGVRIRQADYDSSETLASALQGIDKLLLISSSEVGRRALQHKAIINAAKRAGIKFIAYTSILHAGISPLPLAKEHQETEAMLHDSGIPFALLRNGWYTENYLASVPIALQHGIVLGSAGEGRISSAARADYAEAAATVITREDQAGRIYELAGDESYTLSEFASEIARQAGKEIRYQNLPEAEFRTALINAGLPEGLSTVLSESDVGVSKGGLFDESRQLSKLIGRPTRSLAVMIKAVI